MRKHKFINDPKDLLEQGKRIVSEKADNEDRKFVYRVSIVNLMLSGIPPQEMSSKEPLKKESHMKRMQMAGEITAVSAEYC